MGKAAEIQTRRAKDMGRLAEVPGACRETLLHWLLPQSCAHCREDLPKGWPGPLCGGCRGGLVPNDPPFCLRCAEPLRGPEGFCPRCGRGPHACRLIRSAFLYRGPAASLVRAFKYCGRRSAAVAAGRWMGLRLGRFPELGGVSAVVPVPLHPSRERERGYNQARLLCEGMRETTGLPVLELLVRRRRTKPQWDLGRDERLRNLEGAFAEAQVGGAKGARLLVVDDVCTSTGSLEACARALRGAGADSVSGYVFARQPIS